MCLNKVASLPTKRCSFKHHSVQKHNWITLWRFLMFSFDYLEDIKKLPSRHQNGLITEIVPHPHPGNAEIGCDAFLSLSVHSLWMYILLWHCPKKEPSAHIKPNQSQSFMLCRGCFLPDSAGHIEIKQSISCLWCSSSIHYLTFTQN